MIISKKQYDKIMSQAYFEGYKNGKKTIDQAYLKGYEIGKKEGKMDGLSMRVTPNEIRNTFGLPPLEDEVK